MLRVLVPTAVALAALAAAPTASSFGGLVPADNVSCTGLLAAAANPNNGYVLQNLVKPALEADGVTLGSFQSDIAKEHPGAGGVDGLEACIPDF
jgi:hypothetical protein